MNVWIVIGDIGNSQEAEEYVDSVWLTQRRAQRRCDDLVSNENGLLEAVRLECRKVGKVSDKPPWADIEGSTVWTRRR